MLEKRVIACANIIKEIHSKYWWNGKIESADETLIFVKTQEKHIDSVIKETKKALNHVMVKVGGLCDMCKDRIETAALSVKGVESANWESESQMLHLNFDAAKTTTEKIQKAVANVGHDTEKYKATDEVYNKLPECCLYREE